MKRQHVVMAAVILTLAVAGTAVAQMPWTVGSNVHKITGEVLMMTSNMMQVGTREGTIAELAITEDSDIDERVNKGDRVEVWYRESGEAETTSKVVMRSSASMDMDMDMHTQKHKETMKAQMQETKKMKDAPDLAMIEGEVVDEKPALIHLATREGEIVELHVGENSDLDERVNEGDFVKVWYRQNEAGSKAVVKSSRSMRVDTY